MAGIDNTITLLSQDNGPSVSIQQHILQHWLWALPLTVLAAFFVSQLADMSPREDYFEAILTPFVLVKQLAPLLVLLGTLPLFLTFCRPEGTPGRGIWPPIAAASMIDIVILIELIRQPSDTWLTLIVGSSLPQCLLGIITISMGLLTANLLVLRRGAVTRPLQAGFVAGLIAGCGGTLLYAVLCTEDSPLFYGSWYSTAILLVAGLGTLLGSKVLRW